MKTRALVPSPDSSYDSAFRDLRSSAAKARDEVPGWRVPAGPALIEFAFRKGFVAGILLRPKDGSGHEKNKCRKV